MNKITMILFVTMTVLICTSGITTLLGMQEPQEVFGATSDAAKGRMAFGVTTREKLSSLTARSVITDDAFTQLADHYATTLTNAGQDSVLNSVFILAGPVFYQETQTKRKEYQTGQEALVKILFKDMCVFLLENKYARALLKKKQNGDVFVQLLVHKVQAPCKQTLIDVQETLSQYICQECTHGKRTFSFNASGSGAEEPLAKRSGRCAKVVKGVVKWIGIPALVAHGFASGQVIKNPAAYVSSFVGAYIVSTIGMIAVHIPFWIAHAVDRVVDL